MEKKDSFVYTLLQNGRAVYMGVSKRFRHSVRKCKLKGSILRLVKIQLTTRKSQAKEICLKKLKNRESRHKAKLKYNQNDEILKELNSLNTRKLIFKSI